MPAQENRTAKLRTVAYYPEFANKLPLSPVANLGKLRIANPARRFALDGGTALAFLAQ